MSDNSRTIFALREVGYRMLEAADWLEEEQAELDGVYAQILRVKVGTVNEHLDNMWKEITAESELPDNDK